MMCGDRPWDDHVSALAPQTRNPTTRPGGQAVADGITFRPSTGLAEAAGRRGRRERDADVGTALLPRSTSEFR